MAELKIEQPLTQAAAEADIALRSNLWDSLKVAIPAWLGSILATTGAVVGLQQAKMIESGTAWGVISAVSGVVLPVLLATLEFRRLHERSTALQTVMRLQREYDILILDAAAERDQARARVIELTHQNAAISNMTALVAAAIRSTRDRAHGDPNE